MGIRSIYDGSIAVMYCATSDTAFGPVFYEKDGHDAGDRMEAFLGWLPKDARNYSDNELRALYNSFCILEESYWKAKEDEDTD